MENYINSFQDLSELSNDAPYYFRGKSLYTTGWKMHLFLNSAPDKFPDLHNETIQKISKFLIDRNLEHKFRNGNDGDNTFCIYIGDRNECETLAKELVAEFGREFSQLSQNGNSFSGSDQNLLNNPNIGIRFDGVNENLPNSPFFRYGANGIPEFLHDCYLASSVLGRDISKKQEDKLKKVAAHIILAKFCGEKYLGKNYQNKPWDSELFGNVSEFSAEDINKYTQVCVAIFNPQKYIKPTSRALDGEGYNIDVGAKLRVVNSSTKPMNQVSIKNHNYSLADADNVQLFETKDKAGEKLVWRKGDKNIAQCTIMKEGHSFVSLYDEKDNKSNFMIFQGNVYRVVNGKAEDLESGYLSARVQNIAIESAVIKKGMVNFNTKEYFGNRDR